MITGLCYAIQTHKFAVKFISAVFMIKFSMIKIIIVKNILGLLN